MNFINRAFKNVTRKVSKSILLTLTFFLIGNLVIIGLGVANASNSAKILTRKKMRAVVTYSLDYNKIWQYMESIEDEDERITRMIEYYLRYDDERVAILVPTNDAADRISEKLNDDYFAIA